MKAKSLKWFINDECTEQCDLCDWNKNGICKLVANITGMLTAMSKEGNG